MAYLLETYVNRYGYAVRLVRLDGPTIVGKIALSAFATEDERDKYIADFAALTGYEIRNAT